VYGVVTDLATLGPILSPLGFQPLPEANETLSGVLYHTLLNDFGPHSVDGWLSRVVGAELGETSDPMAQKARGRRLVTILFTDIVESTAKAAALGDRQWSDVIEAHHAQVRRELSRFRGREINNAGDGFFAMFESPVDAILCARAISASVAELGISIRAGVHTGECEVIGEKLGGIAVHIGARVAAIAGANELLASSTVKDLVAGSGIRFEDRGGHVLKGVPGEWRLFAVTAASSGGVAPM
jgi:class 3 adenylate cyclase